jgi:hypothetical protein
MPKSFTKKGTPAKGAFLSTRFASSSARSMRKWMTAFNRGFTASKRAAATSTSVVADTSPRRTKSAKPSASYRRYSAYVIEKWVLCEKNPLCLRSILPGRRFGQI